MLKGASMQIETHEMGDLLLLKPMDNRLDASSANALRGTVVDRVNMGHRCIVLDLANVDFIDSSGLAAVISCSKALGSQGSMVVCNAKDKVRHIFELTRMKQIFSICETWEEAVKALGLPS